jgi:hypothetical protein
MTNFRDKRDISIYFGICPQVGTQPEGPCEIINNPEDVERL